MAKFYLSLQGADIWSDEKRRYVADKKTGTLSTNIKEIDLFDTEHEINQFVNKNPGKIWGIHRIEHL